MVHPGPAGPPEQPDDDDPRTEPLDVAPLMSMAELERELAAIAEDARRAAAEKARQAAAEDDAQWAATDPDGPDRAERATNINSRDWNFTSGTRRRRSRPTTKQVGIAAGAGAAVLALIVGGWVLASGDDAPPAQVSHRNADAESKLTALLPTGYAAGVCNPVEPTRGATAEIHCGRNTNAYGPNSASYSLFGDPTALAAGVDQVVKAGTPVLCPGNIMSPGPWHRGNTPQVAAGTLLCTQIDNAATLAWSTTDKLLLTIVSDPAGFDQLNAWWIAHA
ncbi:hypothetical protein A7R75_24200 [Mycolicibacterium llatzerense]|nr:hypothetical protein [Mycolicibacterium llatzerense]